MPTAPRARAADETRIIDALRRLVRAILRGGNEAEKRTGVSGAQLFVLQQLADGRPRSMREVAALTLTHQSTVSVVVGRLVAKGLVARGVDPDDRRRVLLTPTAAGRALLRRAPEPVQARLVEGIARLPERDRRIVARALGRIVRDIGAGGVQAGMFLEPGD